VPKTGQKTSREALPKQDGLSARDVLKTRDFWLLSTAIMFGGVAGSAVILHQMPYMDSVGISRQTAGVLVIVLSLSNVAGRLLFGWLGDVMEKRACFAICTGIKAGGVVAFALSTTTGQFIPSMIALGIGFGGLIPLRPALQVEFFGMKAFATVQGLLMAFITVGGIVAPLFAGWMYDVNQSYRLAFVILAGTTLAAIPMVLAVHRVPAQQAPTTAGRRA
jgi:MFS family permease